VLKLLVYSIYDSKAEAFTEPKLFRTRGLALRSWMAACQSDDSDFRKYAGDYTFFEIGEWDAIKGEFTMYMAKVNLGLASSFINGGDNA